MAADERYPPHLLDWARSLNEPTRHVAIQKYLADQTAALTELHDARQHLAPLGDAQAETVGPPRDTPDETGSTS